MAALGALALAGLLVVDGHIRYPAGQGDAHRLLGPGYDKVMTAAFFKATGIPVSPRAQKVMQPGTGQALASDA